jgi:hypothetical protein
VVRVAARSAAAAELAANAQGWNWMPPEALSTQFVPFLMPDATVGTVAGAS